MLVVQQTIFGPLQPLSVPVTSLVDLTTALSFRLDVLRKDGTSVVWTVTLTPFPPNLSVTATQAYATYVLAPSDISSGGAPWRGVWRATPVGTFSAGQVTYPPAEFRVVGEQGQTS